MSIPESESSRPVAQSAFVTTHWSVVLAAGESAAPGAAAALETLCRTYWYPLYAYARRRGHNVADAQDLIQGFFARLLEKHYLRSAVREKGKFRSFLLASLNHFLLDEAKRARAEKRGGQHIVLSLDEEAAEGRYAREPAYETRPEEAFDRHWALALLDQALARLKAEAAQAGKTRHFERLHRFLSGPAMDGDYAAAAAELGVSAGAVAKMVQRFRQRYRELVREEVAHTVTSLDETDEEMRYLLSLINS